MKNAKVLSALGLMSLASTAAMAAGGPTLGSALDASGLKVSGAVAASVRQNAHVAQGTFQVDQALLSIAFQPKEGFGAVVDLASGVSSGRAGSDQTAAKVGQPVNTNQAGDVAAVNEASVALTQAYLQYSSGKLTLIGGRYYTAAGAEVFPVTGNLFVTRSLAYAGINNAPNANITGESTYHTGVRANYAYSDTVSLIFGINNGVFAAGNDQSYALLKNKNMEFGLNWKPASGVSVALVGNQGKTATDSRQTLYTAVGSWDVSSNFNLTLSWDEANPDHVANNTPAGGTTEYSAAALYATYAYSDKTKLGLRVEEINPKDNRGAANPGQNGYGSVTGVISYAMAKNFDLKTELSSSDAEGAATRQIGAAVQGVLKF